MKAREREGRRLEGVEEECRRKIKEKSRERGGKEKGRKREEK